jgi:DNA primase
VPGRINDEDIQALRERADLGSVIGDHTALKRAGSRLKGLCPFHQEKTPSFTVDPGRGVWHCFGCGLGGDVYKFLQQAEALSFPEAVERLARIQGYQLRYEELSPGQRKALGRRTRLTEALAEAAAFYRHQLLSEDGAAARRYLKERGLVQADAEHFGLGWAPDAWDDASRHLLAEGFTTDELVESGLATMGRNGPMDRFRGRILFPIFDKSGRDVVAFGGRVVPGMELRTGPRDGTPPKYINSAESPVYRKSETLYALNWARAEIQRQDLALVVEGYMDVIGLHRAGISTAVATCGTALTEDHFRQLEHFSRRVVLALDADDAGFAAADRARELAEEVGIREVGVLPLPDGQDPADLAARGAEAVQEALAHTKTAVEFQIEHLLRGADTSTPEGQVDAYRRTFPLLARLPDRFLRFSYIRDIVAPAVRLPADRIEQDLDTQMAERPSTTAPPAQPPTPRRPAPGDVAGGRLSDPQLMLERTVLATALQMPDLLPPAWKLVTADDFRAPMSRQLFTALSEVDAGNLDAVLAALPDDDIRARVRALAVSEPTVERHPAKVAELVAGFLARSLGRRVDEVRSTLAGAEGGSDGARALMAQLSELEHRRRDLAKEAAGTA